MSYISVKELSEIRKLVTKRREEILSEISDKKTVTKKQFQNYIEDICDLVISYDPKTTSSSPDMQPFIKLVELDSNNTSPANTSSANETNILVTIDSEEDQEVVAKSSATDTGTKPAKDGVRYKGVIRGLESLTNNDDWSDVWPDDNHSSQQKESPKKKRKTTRQTRSHSNSTNDKSDDNVIEWSDGGQVLGGDSTADEESLTHEEKRRLLAEKTEQRIAKMTKRGSKGVVRLSARVKSDINSPDVRPDTQLKWNI